MHQQNIGDETYGDAGVSNVGFYLQMKCIIVTRLVGNPSGVKTNRKISQKKDQIYNLKGGVSFRIEQSVKKFSHGEFLTSGAKAEIKLNRF